MDTNLNSNYGQAQAGGMPYTTGKVFFVDNSSGANYVDIDGLYKPDSDGVARRYTTITAALAACTADHGDRIVLAPDFSTAVTAAELLIAETKSVRITSALADESGILTAYKADTAIAGATDKNLFTVTGLIEIIQIVGVVGTVIETQANATLLKINPTDGADVDLCSALDISADAAKSFYTITGTVGDALVNTPSGAMQAQATSILCNAGVIELETAADNTGTAKWMIMYRPIQTGSRVFEAA